MAKKPITKEFKGSILKKLQPPENMSVSEVSVEEGIPKSTIYSWVAKARKEGQLIPNSSSSNDDKWRNQDKARIVIETYTMNEQELGEYCRKHGLYTTDINRWHRIFESSFSVSKPSKELEQDLKAQKELNTDLARELQYKEKALAETAALLVLKKKMGTIWKDRVDD